VVGTCAAKLSEAEVFAASGLKGILGTTQVVGRRKIERAVCDPSVNLCHRMYCLRGDRVQSVWPIAARGMAQ
jgi:D-serine deaminase-like pyridoxal phosphate-dependent protein